MFLFFSSSGPRADTSASACFDCYSLTEFTRLSEPKFSLPKNVDPAWSAILPDKRVTRLCDYRFSRSQWFAKFCKKMLEKLLFPGQLSRRRVTCITSFKPGLTKLRFRSNITIVTYRAKLLLSQVLHRRFSFAA